LGLGLTNRAEDEPSLHAGNDLAAKKRKERKKRGLGQDRRQPAESRASAHYFASLAFLGGHHGNRNWRTSRVLADLLSSDLMLNYVSCREVVGRTDLQQADLHRNAPDAGLRNW
jgi:hypothetical protein